MLANYVAASNDTSILNRALPLAEAWSLFLSPSPITDRLPLARIDVVEGQSFHRRDQPLYEYHLHPVALRCHQ